MKQLFLVWCLVLALGRVTSACIHTSKNYHDVVTEKTKQALLFHDGENAHLVIKTSLEATPKSGKGSANLPPVMAWVIPLPSLPSKYEEADPQLFEQLFEATKPKTYLACSSGDKAFNAASASLNSADIEVHPTEFVGDYEITPVEMLTNDAGDALNAWLTKNGFGKVPKENQYFYVSKGVVFLALKIKHLSGSFTDLKPLHIVYKSDKVTLPLKFSSHSGVFDVLLYTFTNHSVKFDEFSEFGMRAKSPSVRIGRGQVPSLDKISGGKIGYLTRFEGMGFNGPNGSVKSFTADPSISANLAIHGVRLLDYAAYLLPLIAAAPFFIMWRRFRKARPELSEPN